jgi:hypothetical protein
LKFVGEKGMSLYRAVLALIGGALALAAALSACGSFGAYGLTTSGLPNIAAQNYFRVVGNNGTPFSGIVSDSRSSWALSGTVPFTAVVLNGVPPFRMIVTKTVADNSPLSVEIINGQGAQMLSSTTQPFGMAAVQAGGSLAANAPPAVPDVRFYMRGPRYVLFSGLIEDDSHSIAVEQRVPTVFLFDSPQGTIDGQFNQLTYGSGIISVDLYYTVGPGNTVVCHGHSNNAQLTLKYPGCRAEPLGARTDLLPLAAPE